MERTGWLAFGSWAFFGGCVLSLAVNIAYLASVVGCRAESEGIAAIALSGRSLLKLAAKGGAIFMLVACLVRTLVAWIR
jgi:hypothetical protein